MSAEARSAAGMRLSKRDRDTLAMRDRATARAIANTSPSTATQAASDEAAADLLDIERLRFIRETAQALFIREGGNPLSAEDCWLSARILWKAKPDDC